MYEIKVQKRHYGFGKEPGLENVLNVLKTTKADNRKPEDKHQGAEREICF